MKNLTQKQIETKVKIEFFARLFGVDPKWAVAIAMVESSLGLAQKSPTGCSGVFQMSTIAMKDLLLSMRDIDDDMVDIVCGIAFLRLLLKRWKTIEKATEHFCDPNDRSFYLQRVLEFRYMDEQG
jgi:membrane-bound lytic murein transglycosylase MltF